jgi:hypothetical protein
VRNKEAAQKISIRESKITVYQLTNLSYWINIVNLAFQGAVLFGALKSLDIGNSSPLSEGFVASVEPWGIILLFASTGLTVVAKLSTREFENKRSSRKGRPDKDGFKRTVKLNRSSASLTTKLGRNKARESSS